MTAASFAGCALTAYGPPVAVFALHIAPRAQLVLLFLASAFFWLVAILFSALIWFFARTPQQWTIFYSVIVQELIRFAFYKLDKRTEKDLFLSSPESPELLRYHQSFVIGLGFATVHGLLAYITILAEIASQGPALVISSSCAPVSFQFASAAATLLMIILGTSWNMLAFQGYNRLHSGRRAFGSILVAIVVATHYAASYSTLAQTTCIYTFTVLCVLAAAISALSIAVHIRSG